MIVNKLNLSAADNGKLWYLSKLSSPSLQCETWNSYRDDRNENSNQAGTRLKASLHFLKHMCSILNCDLILEVSIKRDINYRYRNSEDKYEYSKPLHKIFILSSDGELRTTGKNIKLG